MSLIDNILSAKFNEEDYLGLDVNTGNLFYNKVDNISSLITTINNNTEILSKACFGFKNIKTNEYICPISGNIILSAGPGIYFYVNNNILTISDEQRTETLTKNNEKQFKISKVNATFQDLAHEINTSTNQNLYAQSPTQISTLIMSVNQNADTLSSACFCFKLNNELNLYADNGNLILAAKDKIYFNTENNILTINCAKDYLYFKALNSNSKVRLCKYGIPNSITLFYTESYSSWKEYNIEDWITLNNNYVFFYGTSTVFSKDLNNYYYFELSGSLIYAGGNIMSLVNFRDNCLPYMFCNLFNGCKLLKTAPKLPVTSLVSNYYDTIFYDFIHDNLPGTNSAYACYMNMFSGCTNLSVAPELPATILVDKCYANMFEFCSSLIAAPELPATNLAPYCYNSMFRNCTNLKNAPELPATTLALFCYSQMFYHCVSLSSTPELPGTTLAAHCYHAMFGNCTSLVNIQRLPATTLAGACYGTMFCNCTSLTNTPELPATTLTDRCYLYMFQGCASLATVSANFTDWSESLNATTNWLSNVSENGTFYGNPTLQLKTGVSFIPAGWTSTVLLI